MSIETDTPWGEESFTRDREWYARLSNDLDSRDMTKAQYDEHSERASKDPNYDLFDHYMPTNRPKHDIGRYVMSSGVNVPIITSMAEWQSSLDDGSAMLRSELRQDYDGYSGLLSSLVIPRYTEYPRDERGTPGIERYRDDNDEITERQTIEGPVFSRMNLTRMEILNPHYERRVLGNTAVRSTIYKTIANGLYDGTVNPTAFMRLMGWDEEERKHYLNATFRHYRPVNLGYADVSRWRYIPGIPVRVFRDPVIDGKYYIAGQRPHDHWETTDGRDSPDLEAYDKGVYRGDPKPDHPQYTLPTREIIDLYEKVRTLPYFDQHQAPVVEMQYSEDGKLYFLQYLKTGLKLDDPGEFVLPTSDTSVIVRSVRGATKPEGEQLRIYLDPRRLSRGMEGQGVYVGFELGGRGYYEQAAVMMSRLAIVDALNFKDNHWSSASLTRPPLAIGLWDDVGDFEEKLTAVSAEKPRRSVNDWHDDQLEYINTHVTSNGRQATIDSDWELRVEQL